MVHFGLDAAPAKVVDQDMLEEIVPRHGFGVCIARFSARSSSATEDAIAVAVDCDRLHFFDPARGEAI